MDDGVPPPRLTSRIRTCVYALPCCDEAGLLVVLLTWGCYASIIVLVGAEPAHGLALARGSKPPPVRHANRTRALPANGGLLRQWHAARRGRTSG